MFKSRGDSNIVYKCTVRLLEDTEILECEFHVSIYLGNLVFVTLILYYFLYTINFSEP